MLRIITLLVTISLISLTTAYSSDQSVAAAPVVENNPSCSDFELCSCKESEVCVLTVKAYSASGLPVGVKSHIVSFDTTKGITVYPKGEVYKKKWAGVIDGEDLEFHLFPGYGFRVIAVNAPDHIVETITKYDYRIKNVSRDITITFETKDLTPTENLMETLESVFPSAATAVSAFYEIEKCRDNAIYEEPVERISKRVNSSARYGMLMGIISVFDGMAISYNHDEGIIDAQNIGQDEGLPVFHFNQFVSYARDRKCRKDPNIEADEFTRKVYEHYISIEDK